MKRVGNPRSNRKKTLLKSVATIPTGLSFRLIGSTLCIDPINSLVPNTVLKLFAGESFDLHFPAGRFQIDP